MFLTNKRIAVQGTQPVDMWFQYIQSAGCDGTALQVQVQGWSPMRLVVPQPDYWFVMFNKLAYGRLVLPLPSEETSQTA